MTLHTPAALRKISPLLVVGILAPLVLGGLATGVFQAIVVKPLESVGTNTLALATALLTLSLLLALWSLLYYVLRLRRITKANPDFFVREEKQRIWDEEAQKRESKP